MGYTRVQNDWITRKDLSTDARIIGEYLYGRIVMAGKPWEINARQLQDELGISKHAVYKALAELREDGLTTDNRGYFRNALGQVRRAAATLVETRRSEVVIPLADTVPATVSGIPDTVNTPESREHVYAGHTESRNPDTVAGEDGPWGPYGDVSAGHTESGHPEPGNRDSNKELSNEQLSKELALKGQLDSGSVDQDQLRQDSNSFTTNNCLNSSTAKGLNSPDDLGTSSTVKADNHPSVEVKVAHPNRDCPCPVCVAHHGHHLLESSCELCQAMHRGHQAEKHDQPAMRWMSHQNCEMCLSDYWAYREKLSPKVPA